MVFDTVTVDSHHQDGGIMFDTVTLTSGRCWNDVRYCDS